ncbi:hypothetical protein DFP72DRAFT_1169324 [Ephemerocybe angulata]|uniref:Uncharacterized protein n=1 Tax=Ephemerocybe angulata TaxID=980116 RepID=A0A8H6HZK7_9AGAR|nr:hypothetical protein DFP72DRAFT_1169324 [Tulosesus angulatus]
MIAFERRNGTESTITLPKSAIRVDRSTRTVVGASIGSVVAVVLIVVATLLWRQYRRVRNHSQNAMLEGEVHDGNMETGKGQSETLDPARTSSGERPPSLYSNRPLSDPFAAEVKTIGSQAASMHSPVTTPQKQEFSYSDIQYPPPTTTVEPKEVGMTNAYGSPIL